MALPAERDRTIGNLVGKTQRAMHRLHEAFNRAASHEGATLGRFDVLIDILVAQKLLREVMELYDHKNLDTLPEFARPDGSRCNTTVEVMARAVHGQLHKRLREYHAQSAADGDGKGLGGITAMHIKLEESDVASASYWETDAAGLFPSKM